MRKAMGFGLIAALLAGAAGAAQAQTYGGLSADQRMQIILRCKGIADRTTRATCYDEAVREPDAGGAVPAPVREAPGQSAPMPPMAPPPATTATAPAPAGTSFGGEAVKSRRVKRGHGEGVDRITAKVTQVSDQGLGYKVFTFDNGTVWQMAEQTPFDTPRTGADVTIRKGALGAYYMELSRNASVKVNRLR